MKMKKIKKNVKSGSPYKNGKIRHGSDGLKNSNICMSDIELAMSLQSEEWNKVISENNSGSNVSKPENENIADETRSDVISRQDVDFQISLEEDRRKENRRSAFQHLRKFQVQSAIGDNKEVLTILFKFPDGLKKRSHFLSIFEIHQHRQICTIYDRRW